MASFVFRSTTRTWRGDTCGGDTLAETVTYYDGTYGSLEPPPRGNPTQVTQWLDGDPSHCPTTMATYDGYGRVVTATNPAGVTTQTAYSPGVGNATMVNTSTQAPQPSADPDSAMWTQSEYRRLGDGAVTGTVDYNGKVTTIARDGFGRPLSITDAGRVTRTYGYNPSSGNGVKAGSPRWTRTSELVAGSGSAGDWTSAVRFSDGFGGVAQTVASSVNPGRQVVSAVAKNSAGLVVVEADSMSQSVPGGGMTVYVPVDPMDSPSATVRTYDSVGRVTSQRVNGAAGSVSTTSYDGLRTTTRSASGLVSTTTVNVLGQTMTVERSAAGSGTRVTANSYDLLGNMTGMTVSGAGVGDQQYAWSFDTLSRRTSAVDPDAGTSTYEYNTSGSVTATRYGDGSVVDQRWDSWQRPLSVSSGGVDVSRTRYSSEVRGMTESVSTFSGAGDEFVESWGQWDQWYRPGVHRWQVPQGFHEGLAGQYSEALTYRTGGSVSSVSLSVSNPMVAAVVPDVVVSNTITESGAAESLTVGDQVVVSDTSYADSGELTSRTWGRDRLRREVQWDSVWQAPARVSMVVPGGGEIAGQRFERSQDGMVSAMRDTSSGLRWCYRYDGFAALVQAFTVAGVDGCGGEVGPESDRWRVGAGGFYGSWGFDGVGRVVSRVSGGDDGLVSRAVLRYSDGGVGPNAVRSMDVTGAGAGVREFGYDVRGQRVSRVGGGDQVVSWSPVGRPATVTAGDGSGGVVVSSLVYGGDGSRIAVSGGGSASIFLGGLQVTASGSGGAVSVSGGRQFVSGSVVVGFTDSTVSSSRVLYSAADVQSSVTVQADPAVLSVSAGWVSASYTPYGSQRVTGPGIATDAATAPASVPAATSVTGTSPPGVTGAGVAGAGVTGSGVAGAGVAGVGSSGVGWVGDVGWLNLVTDPVTGFTQTGQRLYDQDLQQFISPDPLLDTSAPNPYTYALNNPIMGSDPTGLYCTNYVEIDCGENGLAGPPPPLGSRNRTPLPNMYDQGGVLDYLSSPQVSDPGSGGLSPEAVDTALYVAGGLVAAAVCVFTAVVGCLVAAAAIAAATSVAVQIDNPDGVSWSRVLFDGMVGAAAGPAVGALVKGAGTVAARGLTNLTTNAAKTGGMGAVRAAGQAGERAAGIVKNTERIPSLSNTAAYRIPDELGNGVLGEVKNVSRLSYSNQLRDFASYAQQEGLQFNLYVRGGANPTRLSGPLQQAVDSGQINLIPRL